MENQDANEQMKQVGRVEVQLARLDERFKIVENVPRQLNDLERKIDDMTKYLSSEYVRKDELDRILKERKSALLSTQGVIIGILNILVAALISFGLRKA